MKTLRFMTPVLLLVLGINAVGTLAQEADDTVLRVSTRLVLVDVIVRDDDGPVEDLTAENFTLFDEGVEQPVSVFSVTRSEVEVDAIPLPEGVVSNRQDSRGRTPTSVTAILIDRLNTGAFQQPFADHQVREFIDSLGDNDRVAIYELTNTLRILHDYMDDPALAMRSLDGAQAAQTLGLAGSEDALNPAIVDRLIEAWLAGNNPDGPAFGPQAELTNLIERTYLGARADTTAAALEAIVQRLSTLPGRKNLVWLAGSFPFSFEPYRHNAFNFKVRNSTLDRMEATGRVIVDANVAVYPLYAGGLDGGVDPAVPAVPGGAPGTPFNQIGIDLMIDLAQRTGGDAFFNTNGLATSMRRVVEDARITYTLGFYVNDDELDTGFHELDVRVEGDDLEVRHRQGYYGFGGKRPTEITPGLLDLLVSPTEASTLGLMGSAVPVEGAPDDYDLVLVADVRDLNLDYDGTEWRGGLQAAMYFASLSEGVRFLPVLDVDVRMSDADFQTAQQTGLTWILTRMETAGNVGWLRLVLRDPTTGNAGSLRVPVGLQ